MKPKGGVLMGLTIGMIFILSVCITGCSESESIDTNKSIASPESQETATTQDLTINDLPDELELSAEQKIRMEAALGTLAQNRSQRQGGRGGFPGRDHSDRSRPDRFQFNGLPPMALFLEECSTFLEPDQFLKLAETLSERSESMQRERMRDRSGFRDHMMDRLLDGLDLTEEQKYQLKDLRDQSREQIRSLFESVHNGSMTPEQAIEESQVLDNQIKTDLQSILTGDQYTALETILKDRINKMVETRIEHVGVNAPRFIEVLGNILDLSDQQTEQVEGIVEGSYQDRVAVLQGILDDEISPLTAGFMMIRIGERIKTEIQSILDPEQTEIFEQLESLLLRGFHHWRGGSPGMMF